MKKSHFLLSLIWVIPLVFLSAQPSLPPTDCSPFIQPPIPLNTCTVYPAISYPEKALRANIEGMVQVQIQVDTNGKYLNHRIVQSSHVILSEAVSSHIPLLEFSPAQDQGKAVPGCMVLPFIFRIGEEKRNKIVCPPNSPTPSKKIVSQYRK